MRLIFGEHRPNYDRYLFPYTVWAVADPGERPSDLFAAGFRPSDSYFEAYHLSRQLRIDLRLWQPSARNRRILRQGAGIAARLTAISDFELTAERRATYKANADALFGEGVMPLRRLDAHFSGRTVTHVLVMTDEETGAEIGVMTLYLAEDRDAACHWFSFYHPRERARTLGLYMLTSAVAQLAAKGYRYLYVGTCYSRGALYKTRYPGVEFFNGFGWSSDMRELHYLLDRGAADQAEDLLETDDFYSLFHPDGLRGAAAASPFRVTLRGAHSTDDVAVPSDASSP